MAKSHPSPGSLFQHPHHTHGPRCAPAGSSCPKPPALPDHCRLLFSSESACDRHGEQQGKARAGSCALVGQAWLPSLLSSRLAALMEMEALARTVPVLPISTGRRRSFPRGSNCSPAPRVSHRAAPRRHPQLRLEHTVGPVPAAGAAMPETETWGPPLRKTFDLKNSSLT